MVNRLCVIFHYCCYNIFEKNEKKFRKMDSPYPMDDPNNPLDPEELLTLKPFEYKEYDNFENSGSVALHIYCHDRQSNTLNVRINNFRVYCCIELPDFSLTRIDDPSGDFKKCTYEPQSSINWDRDLSNALYETLCIKSETSKNWKTKNSKESPFDHFFGHFKDIYFYRRDTDKKPYLYLYFHTLQGRSDMMNTINFPIWFKSIKGYVQLKMHENKISTFRRLHSKQNIKYSQWIYVNGRHVPFTSKKYRVNKECTLDYIIDYKTMVAVPPKLSASWLVYPKLFSWDGEMYSENNKQMPKYKRPMDSIYLISVVFQFMEHPETMKKYCLCYGECGENPDPGTEVIKYGTEKDMLLGFFYLYNYLNPDLILGYNTSGFDYPYIIGRLDRLGMHLDHVPSTSRLLRSKITVYSMNWASSGGGKNSITLLQHDGRVDVDMLPNIRRLYKLRQYTLQFVSMKWLKEGKHDIKAQDMFRIYEDSRAANKGVLVKDIDGEERVLTMDHMIRYCVQDSILPIRLFDNRKIWYHLSSLSAAAGVSMSELFTRGEQIRCYSNIADECFKQGKILSNPQYFDYYFKGGFVGKPKPGVYKYVFTLDFASLYPSIMRAYNISIDSIIKVSDWTKYDPCEYDINYFESEEPLDFVSTCYLKDLEERYKIRLRYNQWVEEYEWFKYVRSGGQNIHNISFSFNTDDEYNLIVKKHMVWFTDDDYKTMLDMGLKGAKQAFKIDLENPEERIEYEPDYFEDLEDIKNGDKGLYSGKVGVKRRYEIRIIKQEIYRGIMNILETEWFQGRVDIKKLKSAVERKMETDSDPALRSEHSVHDAGQNARKIMMNSGYGFNGVPKGMLPALPVAILTTALGRRLIGEVNTLLLEEYKHMGAKIVYNDTDSSMVMLDIKDEDVLSGKVNLKKIMDDMEDFVNGRKERIVYNKDSTIIKVEETFEIIPDDIIVKSVIPTKTEKHENGYVKILTCEKVTPFKKDKLKELANDVTLKNFKIFKEFVTETWIFTNSGKLIDKTKVVEEGKILLLANDKVEKYENGMIQSLKTQHYLEEVIDGKIVKKIITRITEYSDDATVKEVISKIDMKFKNELKMECENCTQMCPLKPKYYIKLHREVVLEKILMNGPFKKEEDGSYMISTKGILSSKRGNAQFANNVYDTLVNQVIFIKSPVEMLSSLTKHMCDFLGDRFNAKDLCKVTELGSDYVQETYYMNVFANYLASQGMDVKAGDRLEYLIVRTKKEISEGITENVGSKCREYTMWMNDTEREKIDYGYYIEKGLQEQYDCLFGVGNSNIIDDPRLADLGYKPSFRHNRKGDLEVGKSTKHFIHFSKPIKMISALVKDYMNLTDQEFAEQYSRIGFYYDPNVPRNQYIGVILNTFMDRICKYLSTIFPQDEI